MTGQHAIRWTRDPRTVADLPTIDGPELDHAFAVLQAHRDVLEEQGANSDLLHAHDLALAALYASILRTARD
jgi:hypothetical protein